MSESTRGEKHPMYGKHLSEEHKRKLSEAHKRENLSEETLRKMSEARKGKHLSEEQKRKLVESNSRKVLCVETGTIYNSVNQAALNTGSHGPNISAVCRGKTNTAAGYHWKYVN